MPLEHGEPVTCVTYSLDAPIQIAAAQANLRRQILSRRTAIRIGVAMVLFAAIGAVFGVATGDSDPLALSGIFAAEVAVIFPLLYLGLYALVGRRVRRLVAQSPLAGDSVEACWSEAGFSSRTPRGKTDIAWRDYHGWREAPAGFLLYFNDQQYQLVPATVLPPARREALRAVLERSGLARL